MNDKAELSSLFGTGTMKLIPTIGVAVAIVAAPGLSLAETSRAPLTRAEVKAETRALQSAHKLAPPGRDGINNPYTQLSIKSTKTRSDGRLEAVAARANGELRPAGDAGDVIADRVVRATPTTTVRAQRKAETRAAELAGRLTAGERPDAPAK